MLNIGSVFTDLHRKQEGELPSNYNDGIFFDEATERVVTIKTDCNDSIFNIYSLGAETKLTLKSRERGQIRWISFSTDLQIASIQKEDTVVDFIMFTGEKIIAEFRQTCKEKGAIILGVHWITDRQIVFITDAGCEFYLVNSHRKTSKMLRNVALSVNWFSYYHPSKLFVFASGIPNNSLSFYCFQNNIFQYIGKLELDFGISPAKPRLLERDITISSIYGKICLLALYFEPAKGSVMGLNIFEFSEEQPQIPKLKHFIRLDLLGLVGMQILENLIVIHHKSLQQSLIFDVKISTEQPINSGPIYLEQKLADHLQNSAESFLYNSAWKMSRNGFIIDMQWEIFTHIELNIQKTIQLINNLEDTIQFLINRTWPKKELLELLHRIILRKELKFTRITQLLEQILYKPNETEEIQISKSNNKWNLPNPSPFCPLTVSHNNILRTIFEPLYHNPEVNKKLLANLMIDFLLKLKQRKIKIQNHYMPELLLKIVADAKMWSTLGQFFQYRVIDDSKFLAFELISLTKECPAFYQNALDMLNRRGNSFEIAEVLLGRGQILEALSLISEEQGESQRLDKICLKLIAAAWGKYPTDRPLMFTVFSHLEKIGKLKSLAQSGNEDFERFAGEFERLYGDNELREAEMRFRMARLTSIRRRRDSHFNDSFTSTIGDENDQILSEIQADVSSMSTFNIGDNDKTSSSS